MITYFLKQNTYSYVSLLITNSSCIYYCLISRTVTEIREGVGIRRRYIVDYHSYTDDIQLHCRLIDPNNIIHLLNNFITDIHNWPTNNSFSLNCLKTESLHIKTYTTIFLPPQITINNLSIYYSIKVKTVGILIDPIQ